jgi:hypothetical protein
MSEKIEDADKAVGSQRTDFIGQWQSMAKGIRSGPWYAGVNGCEICLGTSKDSPQKAAAHHYARGEPLFSFP